MHVRRSTARFLDAASGGLRVPVLAKVGGLVIAFGLGLDTFEHTIGHSMHDALIGAFPLGEHFAHLVVVVGMVLVLAGIVADGIRMQRRLGRREGRTPHAVR
ncbi:MAG TPA: hypothetical protein VHL56_00020 [Candidatus Limnocylindrales bacterium]|jgi:hypothetical protein|nr:hypothetical protein [Candidatus Limnocylindrales bacterium]